MIAFYHLLNFHLYYFQNKPLLKNAYLKDLSVGTLETVKLMPGYDKAIEKLKTKVKDGQKEKVEVPATEDA